MLQVSLDISNVEQPYDTTYAKDYSMDASTNTCAPTSILRTPLTKKLNEEKRNKSVKFSESVTISNGFQTSSSFVNDIGRNGCHNYAVHNFIGAPLNPPSKVERPLTAPGIERQSILQTTPLLFPAAPNVQPQSSGSKFRPGSTGQMGILRNDLRRLQENYSKSATHRKFHGNFPERAPDIRRTPDMRITTNERRHVIPEIGCHGYYFHG